MCDLYTALVESVYSMNYDDAVNNKEVCYIIQRICYKNMVKTSPLIYSLISMFVVLPFAVRYEYYQKLK